MGGQRTLRAGQHHRLPVTADAYRVLRGRERREREGIPDTLPADSAVPSDPGAGEFSIDDGADFDGGEESGRTAHVVPSPEGESGASSGTEGEGDETAREATS